MLLLPEVAFLSHNPRLTPISESFFGVTLCYWFRLICYLLVSISSYFLIHSFICIHSVSDKLSYTTVTRERAVIIVFWICIHIIQYWSVYFISGKTAEFTVLLLFQYAKLVQWFKSFPLWQYRLCCILPTDNFPTSMSFENTLLIMCAIPSNIYETVHIAHGVHSCVLCDVQNTKLL